MTIAPSRAERVRCPLCGADVGVFMNDSILEADIVTTFAACGHDALYVQKDFNRWVGITLVGIGIAVSVFFFARREPVLAMAASGATVLVDFCVSVLVVEVTAW